MLFDQNKRRNLQCYGPKCAEGLGYQGIPAHQHIFVLMFREFYLKVVCSFFLFFVFSVKLTASLFGGICWKTFSLYSRYLE